MNRIVKLPNDVLTRVRETRWGRWPFPVRYMAGMKLTKRPGLFFRISHFSLGKDSGAVYANGHFVGDSRHKTALLIGDDQCFEEKLIL